MVFHRRRADSVLVNFVRGRDGLHVAVELRLVANGGKVRFYVPCEKIRVFFREYPHFHPFVHVLSRYFYHGTERVT